MQLPQFDFAGFRQRLPMAIVSFGLLVMVVGVVAFAVSLRPCRIDLDKGTEVTYRLTTERTEIGEDGQSLATTTQREDVSLVVIGSENEVALIVGSGAAPNAADLTLLAFAGDGTARCLDPAGRPLPFGRALGFFDFNLLPLPPDGSDQEWKVTLVYAALPADRRAVAAQVKRTRTGGSPEFQLKLPDSVEWLGADGRYRQVRNLICTYRFDGGRGLVDRAQVKLVSGLELPPPGLRRRWRVTATLELLGVRDVGNGDGLAEAARALRDAGGRQGSDPALAARLARIRTGVAAIDALATARAQALSRPPAWSLAADAGHEVERIAAELRRAGWPVRQSGARLLVGPWPNADARYSRSLQQRYPRLRTAWIRE